MPHAKSNPPVECPCDQMENKFTSLMYRKPSNVEPWLLLNANGKSPVACRRYA